MMNTVKQKPFFIRIIPLLILLAGLTLFFYFRLYRYFSLESLKTHRHLLLTWVDDHYFVSSLAFIVIYIVFVAMSVPNALFLTLAGGFLFGPIVATIYIVFAATIGATLIFLAARTAFRDFFANKAGKLVQKLSRGFQENATSYMLFLRLVPLFPFALVNVVPALLGVDTATFFFTTLFGIIPGTAVYAFLGNGLGVVIDKGAELKSGIIFQPAVLIPLICLATLSLAPIIYKKLKRKKRR